MAEQRRFAVVAGSKAKGNGWTAMRGATGVREATTGQVLVLPQVMAVATTQGAALQEAPAPRGLAAERQRAYTRMPEGGAAGEELAFYRKYTEALLRRYVQMTMEAGRVSSVMGREVIGGRASSYRIHGFDDAVIFRLDVEKCLAKLKGQELEVIRRIAIQEYTHVEAAELLGVSLRTVGTRYGRALDRLTGILLYAKLLEPLRGCRVKFV